MLLITPSIVKAVLGFLVVSAYYLVLWRRSVSSDPGPIMTQYEPPRELSPAMLRFIWKERFDDRTFWACVLSMVAKGFARLEEKGSEVFLRLADLHRRDQLAGEESLLADSLFHKRGRGQIVLDLANEDVGIAIWRVSRYFHQAAVGRWFHPNYRSIIVGVAFSLATVFLVASPQSPDEAGALLLGLAAMAPGGYYLFFLLLRIADLLRASRRRASRAVLGRAAIVIALCLPCVAAFLLGGVVLAFSYGPPLLAVTACLVVINVACLLWLRLPTPQGRQLMNEIDGFREFLRSVERFPNDNTIGPAEHAGEYEKYLPYAVALEVEQAWADRFVALQSAFHENETDAGVRPFYLGMWDGEPVEVMIKYTRDFRG